MSSDMVHYHYQPTEKGHFCIVKNICLHPFCNEVQHLTVFSGQLVALVFEIIIHNVVLLNTLQLGDD